MWALIKFFLIVSVAFLVVFTIIDYFVRKKD
jgi:hypothetical protein